MESLRIPVLSLRADDRIKVGLERYERVMRIDDREPGVVKVIVASGLSIQYGYHDLATARTRELDSIATWPVPRRVSRTPCRSVDATFWAHA
jgi:hypothetical protein